MGVFRIATKSKVSFFLWSTDFNGMLITAGFSSAEGVEKSLFWRYLRGWEEKMLEMVKINFPCWTLSNAPDKHQYFKRNALSITEMRDSSYLIICFIETVRQLLWIKVNMAEFWKSKVWLVKILWETKEFCLVSLFNGISTLFRLFNAKAILLEEQ